MFHFLSQPVEKVLEKATKLKSEGRFDKAVSLLQKTVKETPDNLQILLELATLYFQTDQYKSACATFKRAQRLSPPAESELLSLIESLHFERGKPVETGELLLEIYAERRELEHAERVLSSLTEPQLRSLVQRYDHIFKNSVKYKAGSLDRSLTIAYCSVGLSAAIHDYKRSFAMLHKIVQLSASEYQFVLKEAERMITKEWGNPFLLISLADLYAKNGLIQKATENYMRAVELDSSKTREVQERIRLLLREAESEAPMRALIQLMVSSSQFQEALDLIGKLKNLGVNPEEITRLYNEVVRLDPSSSEAHLLLGNHFSQQKRFDSAGSEYVKVIELDSAKMDVVVDRLEEILNETPNEYLLDIAFDILFSKGYVDKAVEILANVYESDAGFSENVIEKVSKILAEDLSTVTALVLLGKIYFRKGELQKASFVFSYLVQISEEGARIALPLVTSLVEKDPELIYARVVLADTHVMLKDFEKALEVYFGTLDSDPELASAIIPKIDLLLRERRSLARRAVAFYSERSYLDPLVRHYATAEALALAEDYPEALQEFQQCIEYRPDSVDECIAAYKRMLEEMDNPDVRFALGDAYRKIGKFEEALEEFNRAVSLSPERTRDILKRLLELKGTNDAAWIRKAIIDLLIKNHLHSQAAEEIRLASEKFPTHRGSFHLALARMNQDRGLFQQAVVQATKAIEEDRSLASDVIKTLEKQKQMDKADLRCLMTLAQAYEFSKRYNKAIDELGRIAEIYPERIDWAIDRLEQISQEDYTNPKLSYVRGRLLLTQEKTGDAVNSLSKAFSLDRNYLHRIEETYVHFLDTSPLHPDILLALARIRIEKGSFPGAIKMLAQLTKQDPSLRGPVVRELRRILEKEPRSVGAMRALAQLYMNEEKYDLSLQLLRKLMNISNESLPWVMKQLEQIHKKESDNPKCLRAMGYAYLRLDDLKESCRMYGELLQLDGEELAGALTDLKQMAEGHPDRPDALYLYARMLSKRGLVDESCKAFRRLVNVDPSFEQNAIDELESMSDGTPEAELPYLVQSELLERRGEYKRAIDTLSIGLKEVQSNDNVIEFHILLAHAYNALDNPKRARKELKMAKNRAEFKEQFFKRLRDLKQERLDFEVAKLRAELNSTPADDLSKIRLAKLLRKRGDIHKAIDILRVSPEEPILKKRRALEVSFCLADKGELLTALETLNSLVISSPPETEDLEILYTLATFYRRMSNPLPAIACLKLIREADPEYRDVRNLLGQAYKRLTLFRSGATARTIMGTLS